jgi:Omp85 superfamily domain
MKVGDRILLWLCLLIGLNPCQVRSAPAQDSQASVPQVVPTVPSSGANQDQVSPKKNEDIAEEKEEPHQRGAILIAPLPIVSPAIGSGIVPVVGYIFPFQEKDKISPPSVVGAAGLITNNGSRAFGLGTELFMKENRYELKSAYVRGNINYDLYGVGFVDGNEGLKLPLVQTGQLFFIEFLRNIGWNIFVGPRFITGNSLITLNPASGETPPVPPDTGLQTNLRSVGVETLRDSRPNRFYPTNGMLFDFTGDFFSQGLGSKYSFQSYKFTFNKYAGLSPKQVLAYNLFLCGTGGQPPFYGNCIYGSNNELRGYTAGRYLDRYMFATQLEYRLDLRWRLGLVAFGGFGGVAPGAGQFRTNQFLPAGGTGIRFLLSKKYHVNLRTDFAWGKDNFTWSMGVGEAF